MNWFLDRIWDAMRVMTVGQRRLLRVALLLVMLTGIASVAVAAHKKPAKHALPVKKIHGTLHFRGSLLMRRGEIFLVTKSAKIIAGGDVIVDGQIELSPGAGLTIKAGGKIVTNAPITPQPGLKRTANAASGGGCPNLDVVMDAFTSYRIQHVIEANSSGGWDFSGNGCPGGSVVLIRRVANIEIAAPVIAGTGGPGKENSFVSRPGSTHYCHTNVHREPNKVLPGAAVVRGGKGGPGGNISLQTVNVATGGVAGNVSLLHPGAGGQGGAARHRAMDGVQNFDGQDIEAVSGSGGDGGHADIFEFYAARKNVVKHLHHAPGGSPGNVDIAAGNGGPSNCNGGDAAIVVGSPGTGEGKVPLASVRVADGGNASQASFARGFGGDGGWVRIYGGELRSHTPPHAMIRISATGKGGPGGDGCPAKGGNGGPGGDLVLGGHAAGTVTQSFNGGRAGDGEPPGAIGDRGFQSGASLLAIQSFIDGPPGKRCPMPKIALYGGGTGKVERGEQAIAANRPGKHTGTIAFVERAVGTIGLMNTGGGLTECPTAPGNAPQEITYGPDGNFWFTEFDGNKDAIGRITPGGVVSTFDLPASPSGLRGVFGIAAGPDGNLWFTERSGNAIGVLSTSGVLLHEYPVRAAPPMFFQLFLIAPGPDGNMWFTESDAKVGRITKSGAVSEFPVAPRGGIPFGITAGPDGKVWVAEQGNNGAIGRINVDGSGFTDFMDPNHGFPNQIAAGPDGNLWYVDYATANQGGNEIGRVTPSGNITEFPVGSQADGYPTAITAGPDGRMWWTLQAVNKIGASTTP